MFDVNDKVVKIWTVEEANEFISTKARKIKYEGKEHTFYSDKEVYKYSILLNDNTQDVIFVEDIVTVSADKLM